MAKKRKEDTQELVAEAEKLVEEAAELLAEAAAPEVEMVPEVEETKAPAMAEAATSKTYYVERESKFVKDGSIYTLAPGSEISDATHDVAEVRRQGVPLKEA